MLRCSGCNGVLDTESTHCPHCGAAFEGWTEERVADRKKAAAFGAIGGLVGAVLGYGQEIGPLLGFLVGLAGVWAVSYPCLSILRAPKGWTVFPMALIGGLVGYFGFAGTSRNTPEEVMSAALVTLFSAAVAAAIGYAIVRLVLRFRARA